MSDKTAKNTENTAAKKVSVGFTLDAATHADLKTLAFVRDSKVSHLVTDAVNAFIEANKTDIDRVNGVLSK